ncbi:MAG: hypothetical protein A2Y10_15845 [Planctomycetes bacterium GWF2_41_51]|nr:MAG: hypothetical protein A2Y10_15845 [Planctomycetes bacterium GWF2_41_51]HBG27595.1 hypothetical protein [Phycisphaerales bacterium]
MKSLIKFVLPLILLTAVLVIAQDAPSEPRQPRQPVPPPGQEITEPMPDGETDGPDVERNRGMREHRRQKDMPKEGFRQQIREKENELMTWLEQNDPNKAKELKALKETDLRAYTRRMMFEMRNYKAIMDAQESNPALAEVLKKDMVLKQQRNQLLEQIKNAKDEAQKQELTEQLKDVLEQRFDLIVQKKQLRYEDLKKRLEELQKIVNASQTELETIKDEKAEQVEKHLEELLDSPEKIDWN